MDDEAVKSDAELQRQLSREQYYVTRHKYDSESGWLTFYAPIDPHAISAETDRSLAMERTEALCSRCDAHLGHVCPDGPAPTGERYCMNSAALRLVLEKQDGA